jgi:hypothetical protein
MTFAKGFIVIYAVENLSINLSANADGMREPLLKKNAVVLQKSFTN